MTRRNDKRNERRRNNNQSDKEIGMTASVALGAILGKIFNDVSDRKKGSETEPFDGIHKINENEISTSVIVPADGTAKEIQIPEGFQAFFSEDGKLMIRKVVEEGKEEKKEEEKLTYDTIAKQLFLDEYIYFNVGNNAEKGEGTQSNYYEKDNCTSEAQAKRLMAFNKLQNIAIYLNKGWHPNFNDDSDKYFIYRSGDGDFCIASNTHCMNGGVYFQTEEMTRQAIDIMEKQSLNDLFNPNL